MLSPNSIDYEKCANNGSSVVRTLLCRRTYHVVKQSNQFPFYHLRHECVMFDKTGAVSTQARLSPHVTVDLPRSLEVRRVSLYDFSRESDIKE